MEGIQGVICFCEVSAEPYNTLASLHFRRNSVYLGCPFIMMGMMVPSLSRDCFSREEIMLEEI